MDYSFPELDEMARVLDNEARGEHFDYHMALSMIDNLAETCPDIRGSLAQMRTRMSLDIQRSE